MTGQQIRVLVVDHSGAFREVISRGIACDPGITVAAKAGDPFTAWDKLFEARPDVMICDVALPKVSGMQFIRKLLPQYPIPVIMVSNERGDVVEAMQAGAVDFVTKPDLNAPQAVEGFITTLITKIKQVCAVQLQKSPSAMIIAIGASTGGTEAVYKLLKDLPATMPGMVIAQHIPPVFSRMFAERLNSQTNLKVKEAQTGDLVEQGKVLIAPGNRHMKVKRSGDRYLVECFAGEKVNGHCPSVDVLFESVAQEAGSKAIGIILTGMGHDGAKGLLAMRRQGARTIGQDEQSSVVYGMPKVAFDLGAVEKRAALESIPLLLRSML